jgi:hypothetical protein
MAFALVCRIAQTLLRRGFYDEERNMMIPGAWESRRRSGVSVNTVNVAETVTSAAQAGSAGGNERLPPTPRLELASWIKVVIFAGTLLTAMWLAMTVFFA